MGAHVCFYPSSVKGARLASAIASELCVLLPGRQQSAGASEPCDIEENEDAVCIV